MTETGALKAINDWMASPIPRRLHRCTAAVSAIVSGGIVERCACGAIRVQPPGMTMGGWRERNSRRKHERKQVDFTAPAPEPTITEDTVMVVQTLEGPDDHDHR